MLTRQVTDREFITPRLNELPFFRSFMTSPHGGGLQEQFYNLRQESQKFQATINKLKKEGRGDELMAYFKNNKGTASTRKQVLAYDRYLAKYRKNKRMIEISDMSPSEKRKILDNLDRDMNIALAFVPELKEMSDVPSYIENLFRN